MSRIIIPARDVPVTDLLSDSIDQIKMVDLALHADSALLTDDAIETMQGMLWEAMDRLRKILTVMLDN